MFPDAFKFKDMSDVVIFTFMELKMKREFTIMQMCSYNFISQFILASGIFFAWNAINKNL